MAKSQNQTLGTSSKLEQIFVEWAKSTSGSSIERNQANSYKKSRKKINSKNLQPVPSNATDKEWSEIYLFPFIHSFNANNTCQIYYSFYILWRWNCSNNIKSVGFQTFKLLPPRIIIENGSFSNSQTEKSKWKSQSRFELCFGKFRWC